MISACPSCQAKNRLPAARLSEVARCARCKTPISPLNHPVEVQSVEDFDELINQAPFPVLVDFWAEWCGPCRMVAPEMVKIADQRAGRLVVAKVNTEALVQIAARYRIESIPTMILFRQGQPSQRLSGAQPAAGILRALNV